MKPMTAADYSGRYIHYGIREHGMAAAMNGMTLHGGIIPYSGTFLVFSDYCRPSIRLAALMGERVIHIMTHDSIGLGEDGPTHQPVKHLAALRGTPSVMALTRQNLPQLRRTLDERNKCVAGAYEISPAQGIAQVSIFATGSEVSIAVEGQKLLAAQGVPARVVSVPCFELFVAQSDEARRAVIGDAPVKIGVEAAVRQGWDALIGTDGALVGM